MAEPTIVHLKSDMWLNYDLRLKESLHESVLRNAHGHKCCLGFLCAQMLEVPDETLTDLDTPADLANAAPDKYADKLVELGLVSRISEANALNTDLAYSLMSDNDDQQITFGGKFGHPSLEQRVQALNVLAEAAEAPFRFQLENEG